MAAQDRASVSHAQCETAACSPGVLRACCAPNEADTGAGSYEIEATTGVAELIIQRQSPEGRCTAFQLGFQAFGTAVDEGYSLEVPQDWFAQAATDQPCEDVGSTSSASRRWSLGGTGKVTFSSDACTLDIDVTMYFVPLGTAESLDSVRIRGDHLKIPEGVGNVGCP